MNHFKFAVISAFVAFAIVVAGGAINNNNNVEAASAKLCTLEGLKLNEYAKSFTVSGGSVTGKFTLKGDADCKFDMTLFTFDAPVAQGHPDFFKSQKLNSYKTGSFGPGTHTLTADMPECRYQLDLVTGKPISAKKGETLFNVVNPTNMTNQDHIGTQNNINAHTHDALIGGEACEEPEKCPLDPSMEADDPRCEVCPHDETMLAGDPNCKEEPEKCPLDPSMDADDPNCKVCPYDKTMTINDEDCEKPEEPVNEPETPTTPTQLPKTGAGAAVFSIGAIGAAAKKFIASRRGLKEALLNN